MVGTNLTREEAGERARLLDVRSYEVALDWSNAADPEAGTYRSETTVRFTARTPGASTFVGQGGGADAAVPEPRLHRQAFGPGQPPGRCLHRVAQAHRDLEDRGQADRIVGGRSDGRGAVHVPRVEEAADPGLGEDRGQVVLDIAHREIHSFDSVTCTSSSGMGERPNPGSHGTSR